MNSTANLSHTQTPAQMRGVGLIEVLIAVLVLSIGLLGLAALQTRALANNETAFQRSVAVMESYSIADALRANPAGQPVSAFEIGMDDEAPTGTSFAATAVRSWRQNLEALLGEEATGSINCQNERCTISTRWNQERATQTADDDELQTLTLEVRI